MPINGGLIAAGHTDLPGAAGDTGKICPGAYLPVKVLAAAALATMPTNWKQWPVDEVTSRLRTAGIAL
jgi:hypothetical protein